MIIETLPDWKRHPNDKSEFINPFHYDHFLMGCSIGKNVSIMFEKHNDEVQKYIKIINTETGEQIKIRFKK